MIAGRGALRRGRHRFRWLRRAAWIIAAPALLVAFALSLPILLPLVGLSQARTERRKRAAIERQRCARCEAPLGAEALVRADALFAAYVAKLDGEDDTLYRRLVRDVHACCPRCDACYGYDEAADLFVPLPEHMATAMYAGLLEPATAAIG